MQRNTIAEKEKNKTRNECRERKKTRPGMNVEKHNCRKKKLLKKKKNLREQELQLTWALISWDLSQTPSAICTFLLLWTMCPNG
jgi:hypothetical protein